MWTLSMRGVRCVDRDVAFGAGPLQSRRMPPDFDLETALFGSLVEGRECGDCTACCTSLKIDTLDLRKAADTPCRHGTGRGCGIHATRPGICRAWFCAWRRLGEMPDAARPDRSGLLVSLDFNREPRNCLEGVSVVVRALDGDMALDGAMADDTAELLRERLIPVWLSDGTTKTLVHPRGEVANLVLSGMTPPDRLRDEVEAWRSRYDVFRLPS